VDETEYNYVYSDLNERPCVFAKAVLCGCCGCHHSQRLHIAEREVMACRDAAAQQRCADWFELLQDKSRFALHLLSGHEQLPHAKAIKVQCGGPRGLLAALSGETLADTHTVADLATLLNEALSTYASLDAFPYQDIVRYISHHPIKKRSHRD
jgi:hypothetical protein